MQNTTNVDPHEIENFAVLAQQWWDKEGPFRVLHDVNPIRIEFIQSHTDLSSKKALDVGCGGGILSEALAQHKAQVTAIDMAQQAVEVAQAHAKQNQLTIDYQTTTVETLAQVHPESFDLVTCLELLEHVPDPASIINACAQLLKPGGHAFFSTLNRTLPAYLLAIIGAEYVLRLIPKNTHTYEKFIRPAELAAWCKPAGLTVKTIQGLHYNPLLRTSSLNRNVQINYIVACQK